RTHQPPRPFSHRYRPGATSIPTKNVPVPGMVFFAAALVKVRPPACGGSIIAFGYGTRGTPPRRQGLPTRFPSWGRPLVPISSVRIMLRRCSGAFMDVLDDPPWAMQLAVRSEKAGPPGHRAVCEAAAMAVVALLSDPRAADPEGEWHASV